MVDKFGQYKHKNWPGKIKSIQDLKNTKVKPVDSTIFNKYGGFKNKSGHEKKGYFYTKKVNGKWRIIDPEGCEFFSMGVNSINFSIKTPVDQRKHWFEDISDERFLIKPKQKSVFGYYKGYKPVCYQFLSSNLHKKFGEGWSEKSIVNTLKRLPSWGFNTIGAWSDSRLYGKKSTYTIIIHPWCPPLQGSGGIYGKFPPYK